MRSPADPFQDASPALGSPRSTFTVLVFGQLLAGPQGDHRLTKLVLVATEHGAPAAGRFHCMSEFVPCEGDQ